MIRSLRNPKHTLHIWEGYIDDIFSDPVFHEDGWSGFTRDYQECAGAWSLEQRQIICEIPEYLEDLLTYKDQDFQYSETQAVYEAICDLLESEDSADGIEVLNL